MTESEFHSILLKLSSLTNDQRPEHPVAIEFYGALNESEFESIITYINLYLADSGKGVCEIYGRDETGDSGVMYVKCELDNSFEIANELVNLLPKLNYKGLTNTKYRVNRNEYYVWKYIEEQYVDDSMEEFPGDRKLETNNDHSGCLGPLVFLFAVFSSSLIFIYNHS